jgi:prevent-host-death family protein
VKKVNIQEAKTHLSRLLEEAVAGEEIVIAKAGKPYVMLVPWMAQRGARVLGGWEGRVWLSDDFDETPDEVMRLFAGENGEDGQAGDPSPAPPIKK